MKKIIQLTILFSIATIVLLISCQECTDCIDNREVNSEKPKQAITYEYAKKLHKEFIKTRAEPLKKILNKEGFIEGEDVRDVWFDLNTIEQYIAYVKEQSKEKGYEDLGLRIFYGAYPKEDNYPEPGYCTVFIVPTHKTKSPKMNFAYQDLNNVSRDIAPLNMGSGAHPPSVIK